VARIRVLLVVVALLALALAGWRLCGRERSPLHRQRLLLGTLVEITVYDARPQRHAAAVEAAFDEMVRLEKLMDGKRPGSDVRRLGGRRGIFAVASDTAAVIAAGLDVSEASQGAFDMTLGRLKALWGIDSGHPRVPASAAIKAALAGSGPRMLRVEGTRVVKDSDALIDLGGIAKGYIIDRAVAVLTQAGVRCAAVNAGGDMRLIGRPGRPWRIGIRHPRRPEALTATLQLAEPLAVVTSGDYERSFERDGVRYHHLFDPATGQPARRCQSVTVVARQAMLADALATAVFVLGPRQGLALLRRFPGSEGLIVAADGRVTVSPGLAGQVIRP
jgi:thiamine biosynthesis lipoprotein